MIWLFDRGINYNVIFVENCQTFKDFQKKGIRNLPRLHFITSRLCRPKICVPNPTIETKLSSIDANFPSKIFCDWHNLDNSFLQGLGE